MRKTLKTDASVSVIFGVSKTGALAHTFISLNYENWGLDAYFIGTSNLSTFKLVVYHI